MEKEKNLYLIKTKSYQAYAIAEDMNTAWNMFKTYLEKGDGYGFSSDRNLDSIQLIASTSAYHPKTCTLFDYKDIDMLFLDNDEKNE